MTRLNRLLVLVILTLASVVFILPYTQKGLIIAGGESSIYLNPGYINYQTTWLDKFNFGTESTHQANIFLFDYFWKVLSIQKILHPSVFFIFLSTLLSSLAFYYVSDKMIKPQNAFALLAPSLLYTFNVFRLLGPLNERLILLFIFLPLFFYAYYKFLEVPNVKNILRIAILSILSSSMGANMPVFTIPYVLMTLYFGYYLITHPGTQVSKLLSWHIVLILTILLVNLFWIVPVGIQLVDLYKRSAGKLDAYFTVLQSGTFLDHFRLLGSWGWRGAHNGELYYPYSELYDKPLLLSSTLVVTLLSFLTLFTKPRKPQTFFLVLAVIALILLAGTKGPFYFAFQILYRFIPVFRIYREPFTKFMPLFLLAASLNLVFTLDYLAGKIKGYVARLVCLCFVAVLVLLNAYPFFVAEAIPKTRFTNLVLQVPQHWQDAKAILSQYDDSSNILISPYNTYSTSYNWDPTPTITGNIADYLLPNRLLRAWRTDQSPSGILVSSIFDSSRPYDLKNYLSLFNVGYVLQENDLKWTSSEQIDSPLHFNAYYKNHGLKVLEEFGYSSSLEMPQLTFYEIPEAYSSALVYVPKEVYYASVALPQLKYLTSVADYAIPSAFIVEDLPSLINPELIKGTYLLRDTAMWFDYKSATWHKEWTWPQATIDPSKPEHNLVRLKEGVIERLKRSNYYSDYVEYLIWLGVKRSVELHDYNVDSATEEQLINEWHNYFSLALQVLRDVPDQERAEDYWQLVGKVYSYYQKTIATYPELAQHADLLASFPKSSLFCGSNCATFTFTEAGQYALYIDKFSLSLSEAGFPDIVTTNALFTPVALDSGCNYWCHAGYLEVSSVNSIVNIELADSYSKPMIMLRKIKRPAAGNIPEAIAYEKISSTEYKVSVYEPKDPFVMVFNQSFSPLWKLTNPSSDLTATHFKANGFANAWQIVPQSNADRLDFVLAYSAEPYFVIALTIALAVLVFGTIYLVGNHLYAKKSS